MAYERSFPGYMLIDWLLQNGEIESRRQGLDLCKALLEHDIIQHGKFVYYFAIKSKCTACKVNLMQHT